MFIKMFPLVKWISAFTVLVGTFGYIYANLDPQTWCKMNTKCEMKARAPTHYITLRQKAFQWDAEEKNTRSCETEVEKA